MLRGFSIVIVLSIASMIVADFGVSQEQARRERAERRAREAQQRQEALFGGPLPPGTVTIIGRSLFNPRNDGLGNSVVLMEAARNQNLQRELGLTEAQADQMQAARADIQVQAMMLAPKYINRFKTMTGADRDAVQEELQKEIEGLQQKMNERIEGIVTPEQRTKARTLVFQSVGGVESPLINMDTLEALNLTDAQREKAKATFREMEAERMTQMEEGLKLIERAIEKGGVNMSPEDRRAFEEEGRALQSKILETGKKLGDGLRTHLTQAQLDLEKRLMAERPGFLPPLPRQRWGQVMGPYVPGLDSWAPGQGAPNQTERRRSPFPTREQQDDE